MTTINCSKNCQFQSEGKCCCDSIVMTVMHAAQGLDAECPYLVPVQDRQTDTAETHEV